MPHPELPAGTYVCSASRLQSTTPLRPLAVGAHKAPPPSSQCQASHVGMMAALATHIEAYASTTNCYSTTTIDAPIE